MNAPYHYVESGLDNIYLKNGFMVHETPMGLGVSIKNIGSLHRAIGRFIVNLSIPITGAELRFLRLEMEISQRDLAGLLGSTEQTLRLWEKARNKAIPGPADRLLRAIYKEYVGGDGSVRRMVDKLAKMSASEPTDVCLESTARGWKAQSVEKGGLYAAQSVN